MARSRNIKPSFFMNEVLSECPPLARILFAGLWTIADRDGRLEDRPKKIKAEILPYDDCNCDVLLSVLNEHGFIFRYTAENKNFIQVLTFTVHQNPHQKEQPSKIPAPDLSGVILRQDSVKSGLKPSPESLTPKPSSKKEAVKVLSITEADMLFQQFWMAYPSHGPQGVRSGGYKGSRKKAFEKFLTIIKGKDDHEQFAADLIDAALNYRGFLESSENAWQSSAHASTWLHQERWNTDYTVTESGRGGSSSDAIAQGFGRALRDDGK